MKKKILITTAIDYTNDVVHLGHSYQKVLADSLARYWRQNGREVYFVTGTDEHGGNIERVADAAGKEPKAFVDEISEKDKAEWKALNISYDRFIRTTDPDHIQVVEDFWERCKDDLYEGTFKGLYCYGCEAYKNSSEIIDDKCELHPTKNLEPVTEKNWFFRWSKYKSELEKILTSQFARPEKSRREMLSFLESGLTDIPVSRPKEKISWGLPVPGDDSQTIYVWFDALINYYTAAKEKGFWAPPRGLGSARRDEDIEIIHLLGKDNTRWHALLWPAMLKSAGLRLPDTIYSHGFINLNGQKISKSLGNVIRPSELVAKYGSDAIRYYLLRYGPAEEDVDISIEKIERAYNADLANDWGNLISRIATLCESNNLEGVSDKQTEFLDSLNTPLLIGNFKINKLLELVWKEIGVINEEVNQNAPWNFKGEETRQYLVSTASRIVEIAQGLLPFLPETSQAIIDLFSAEKIKAPKKPLFPRI